MGDRVASTSKLPASASTSKTAAATVEPVNDRDMDIDAILAREASDVVREEEVSRYAVP